MGDETKRTYLRLLVETVCGAAGIWLCFTFGGMALEILLPFILAFITAWIFNPIISFLEKHMRITRKLFSYLLVLVVYAVIAVVFLHFSGKLVSQAIGLAREVPTIISVMQRIYNELETYLRELLSRVPPEISGEWEQEVLNYLATAWAWLRTTTTGLLTSAAGKTGSFALEVPNIVIFLTVLIMASCIITSSFPNLRQNIYTYLGTRGKNSVTLMGHSFRTAVLGYFRSQLIFALIDMVIILSAFFFMSVPYPLPIGLLLCFLDFIPFFGAGTVLIPWGIVCLILSYTQLGVSLLLLYVVLYMIRRIFEPRILGGTTGFSSLQMLLSMYVGMKIYGVGGLVFAPIIWITIVNFVRTGFFDGYYADLRFVVNDLRERTMRTMPIHTIDPDQNTKNSGKKPREGFLLKIKQLFTRNSGQPGDQPETTEKNEKQTEKTDASEGNSR